MSEAVDRRRAAEVGRRARLELVFAMRRGRTVLAHGYAEPPLRVGAGFPDPDGLHYILASSAPGMFGGDRFEHHITLEPGARVRLTSQSALQVHPRFDGGTARLQSTYEVAAEAQLRCEWDPLIPFAASRFDQATTIRIEPAGRVCWSDAFMSGREGHGERWAFHSFKSRLEVWREGALEYLERIRIVSGEDRARAAWVAEDACYFGTMVLSGGDVDADAAERLQARLTPVSGLHAAADRLDSSLLLVRLAASDGPGFHQRRRDIVDAAVRSAHW